MNNQTIVDDNRENTLDHDNHFSETGSGIETEDEIRGPSFKEGQILQFVRVRFPGNARSFPFLIGKRKLSYGQKVVAMSDRGMAVGYVNSFPYEVPFNQSMMPVRFINKVATDEDIKKQQEHYKREKQVETLCSNLITKHSLDMNLTHVEFTQFGKKVVFYFIAPARVDFRELVKDLVGELKLRIELRQISVRDRAASIGGIGPCGRQLCCSSFLGQYGNAGIKMAKNQNISLNNSKINGVCGQLKCCLAYEDEVYEHKRDKLPKEKELIQTLTGEKGRVLRLHVLSEQFDMLTYEGVIRRYSVGQYKGSAPQGFAMPEQFDHVSDETMVVVGLEQELAEKTKQFEKEIEKIKSKTKDFARNTFNDVFANHFYDGVIPEEVQPEQVAAATPPKESISFYYERGDQDKEEAFVEKTKEEAAPVSAPPKEEGGNTNRGQQQHRHQNNRRHHHQNRNPQRAEGSGTQQPREGQGQNRHPSQRRPPNNNKNNNPNRRGDG